jgi:hypothetical protein
MKKNRLLVILLAASVTGGVACSQSSGTGSNETIHPDLNQSIGGSKSERSGTVPLPQGSPSSGTVEKGQSGSMGPSRSTEMEKNTSTTGDARPNDTTKGKDTDQPSQGPTKQD